MPPWGLGSIQGPGNSCRGIESTEEGSNRTATTISPSAIRELRGRDIRGDGATAHEESVGRLTAAVGWHLNSWRLLKTFTASVVRNIEKSPWPLNSPCALNSLIKQIASKEGADFRKESPMRPVSFEGFDTLPLFLFLFCCLTLRRRFGFRVVCLLFLTCQLYFPACSGFLGGLPRVLPAMDSREPPENQNDAAASDNKKEKEKEEKISQNEKRKEIIGQEKAPQKVNVTEEEIGRTEAPQQFNVTDEIGQGKAPQAINVLDKDIGQEKAPKEINVSGDKEERGQDPDRFTQRPRRQWPVWFVRRPLRGDRKSVV